MNVQGRSGREDAKNLCVVWRRSLTFSVCFGFSPLTFTSRSVRIARRAFVDQDLFGCQPGALVQAWESRGRRRRIKYELMFLSSVYQVCICLRSSSMAFGQRFLEMMLIPLVSACDECFAAKILQRFLTLALACQTRIDQTRNIHLRWMLIIEGIFQASSSSSHGGSTWQVGVFPELCFALNENEEGRLKMNNENRREEMQLKKFPISLQRFPATIVFHTLALLMIEWPRMLSDHFTVPPNH